MSETKSSAEAATTTTSSSSSSTTKVGGLPQFTANSGFAGISTGIPPPTSTTVMGHAQQQQAQQEVEQKGLYHPRNDKTAQRHRLKRKARTKAEEVKATYKQVREEHQTVAHRFLGYLGPLGPAVKTLLRYVAYSSDIGEAFRPVVHRKVITGAYAASFIWVGCDVALDTHDKYNRLGIRGGDLAYTASERTVFQMLASMALPAFTIHSAVDYSKKYVFQKKFPQYLRWGPTLCGLAVVPTLPFLFDEPVEVAVKVIWSSCFPLTDLARAKLRREEELHHAAAAEHSGGGGGAPSALAIAEGKSSVA